jgi:Flp pilus assembly secretin CpaC
MRRAFLAAALLAAATPAAAAGDSVALALDEVYTITFKTPVATVYVGNPTIADVTMLDARHAFVQGKGYGRTNIVALNRDNVQVFNAHVTVVGAHDAGTVTLNRGAQRITLTCAGGRCEPTPTLGDDQKAFEAANTQTATHQSTARGVATAMEAKP